MKILITFLIALLLGLASGWIFAQRQADHKVAKLVAAMQLPFADSERLEAAKAIREIEMIQAGESNSIVRLLSKPIVNYYYLNTHLPHNDEQTKKMLVLIEQFASTNQLVANEITNRMPGKFRQD
ncbi:MAG TPA: hypothetical protein VGO57_14170 [Verrucomicrobiae bacterium]|jgi:hypothetical protein